MKARAKFFKKMDSAAKRQEARIANAVKRQNESTIQAMIGELPINLASILEITEPVSSAVEYHK